MKLWIFSDLHLTHDRSPALGHPEADVAIVAGDVDVPLSTAVSWLAENIQGHPVLYVPGNHCFYGSDMAAELQAARRIARDTDVTILADEVTVRGGVRFIGTTLWTDYRLNHNPAASMEAAEKGIKDHVLIKRAGGEAWLPADAAEEHRRSREFLERSLAEPFDGKTVVISHHAPHPNSISARYQGHPINAAFVSDLSDILRGANAPSLWVHGHLHNSAMYRIGGTVVLCNPKGYGDENPEFDASLVVELGDLDGFWC